ncbi:hypothetical protein Scep_022767 [Stephania cephalantha]|uniref:TPR repeat-containing thioredoxin TDX n=1 Tax=Stephania cephalantha TaxID=152367 RepID=A0AAP0FGZ1_9MAGN
MEEAKIAELKQFVKQCKSNPRILDEPSLGFFKSYLQSLGARIPESPKPRKVKKEEDDSEDQRPHTSAKDDRPGNLNDEIVESDIELDETEVVEPDNDPPQKMGDPAVEVMEENQEAAQMAKAKAMDAISEGKLNEAIEHLTEAILLNPSSAILYANRAGVFVKMKKPNAAIRDADAALKINPDSAKGYKFRGIARAMLGQWEEAAKDLHVAAKLDYDEEIGSILKKVEPNTHRIEEHRRKYERLRKEREVRKAERAKQHMKAETPEQDTEALSALKDGHVQSIRSNAELETKFKTASSLSRLVILYFTATWCGPCRFVSPLYKSLAAKYPKVVFLRVDIDEGRDMAGHWQVSSVPSFFFIKNGKEIDKLVGADKSELEKKIAQYAGKK